MKRKLLYNTVSSFVFQATTIICGFILPRLILHTFGSEVNGLVNSIAQFLSIISFLELGVGAVVQSSLYKPLAEKNNEEISKIIGSAGKFFKHLALILLVYIFILIVAYPSLARQDFGWAYTAGLIAAISISSFAQYYFGVVDRLLLNSDQRGYIQYTAQTITLILNTVACAILIKLGCSIHVVKLMTSLIYLARPLFLRWYVNHHYALDRKIRYTGEPIKQKWNGVTQHVAAVVLDGTDTVVLTLFSTLSNVSIYSVYFMVVNGIKQLLISMTGGVQSLIGELWARQNLKELQRVFGWFEWAIHTGTVFIFGCAGVLIVPFIQVYTNGVSDANYIQPLFAALLVSANACHCLRLPYNIMILASGHYRQTQYNYVAAAAINIAVSILAVKRFELVGVAIGTFVAMFYQTVWMAIYDSKNLIRWPLKNFFKQISVDVLTVIICSVVCTQLFSLHSTTYAAWIQLALEVTIIWALLQILLNVIFYRGKIKLVFTKIIGVLRSRYSIMG